MELLLSDTHRLTEKGTFVQAGTLHCNLGALPKATCGAAENGVEENRVEENEVEENAGPLLAALWEEKPLNPLLNLPVIN